MKHTDYILISRNGTLYKARFSALSSVICFKERRNQISSLVEEISSYVQTISDTYSDTHFSKSEMKSEYGSIDFVNSLTANQTYALSSNVTKTIASLSSTQEIRDWLDDQIEKNAKLFVDEMERIQVVMNSNSKSSYPSEYAILPEVKDLVDGTGG